MRNGLILCVLTVMFSGVGYGQADSRRASDSYVGTWTGSWTSSEGGTGELELTLEKTKDGAPGGKITAFGGESAHSAVFKTVTIDGNKMQAKYAYPLGEGGEITLDATFDGPAAKGTWMLRPPGGTADVANGTWTVTKK